MNEVQCIDCGWSGIDDDLTMKTNHYHKSDDGHCPNCGSSELEDVPLDPELTGNPRGCRNLMFLILAFVALVILLIWM
jgi:hypothetical protein